MADMYKTLAFKNRTSMNPWCAFVLVGCGAKQMCLLCVCHSVIVIIVYSIAVLQFEWNRRTKAKCVGNGVQVFTASVKLVRVRLPHTMVLWFVPYCIKFCVPNGTEQDTFSQNQLNFPNKMSQFLYSIAENQLVCTSSSAWYAGSWLEGKRCETDQW
jgi:hypothetical protein